MDCLACGITSSPPSREHVFSRWLLQELACLDLPIGLFRDFGDGATQRVRCDIELDSFKLKRICEACYNGWLSDLENAAKPVILGLMKWERGLDSLYENECRTLARWAAKTAVIESYSVGAECPISAEYLKQIKKNTDGAPGRFAVAAAVTELKVIGHMQIGIIRDLLGGGKAAGNIVVIALPRLVFACAFPLPELPYECRCVKSLFTPLLPHPAAWYPMKQTAMPAGLDERDTLAAMAERIELFQSVK